MIEQIQRLSTKALIRKEGKVLMVCEPDGNWELPGGKPDFGEHMEETIKRELREELGTTEAKVIGVFGQLDFRSKLPEFDKDYQFVIIVFSVEIGNENFVLSAEHNKFAWFTPDEIQKLDIKPEYKEFFRKYL